MKKFLLILLCSIFVFLFVACAKRGADDFLEGEDPLFSAEGQAPASPFSSLTPSLDFSQPLPSINQSVAPTVGQTAESPSPSTAQPLPSATPSVAPTLSPSQAPSAKPSVRPSVESVTYVRVQANGLRVRKKASTSATVLGSLDRGDMVVFLGKENGFYKTWYKEKVGYVAASYCDFIAIVKGGSKVEKAIEFAHTLLGYPYVWGSVRYHDGDGIKNAAFTGKEFDCSALVQYVYYAACKVKLGTTTREQVKNGTAVKKSQIRRGDLLFFTNADRAHLTGNARIGHVAIYLGENYILHTASDYAVIEPISSARWANYITARRVV